MKLTSKDELLQFGARRYRVIEHPKYGSYRIQSLSQGDWGKIEAAAVSANGSGLASVGTRMIAVSLVNENGSRLFGDGDRDLEHIENLDAQLTRWMARQIEDHCGLNEQEAEDELKKTNDDSSPTS